MTGTDDPPTRRRRDEEPGCDEGPGGGGCGPAGGADDSPTGETAESGHVDESTEGEHADGGGHAAEDGTDDPSDPSGWPGRPLPDQVRVEGGSPSDAVLRAVEAVTGVEVAESEERLGEVVDVDALDALFVPGESEAGDLGRVEFSLCGCRITVEGDGRVHATPDDAA